MSTKADLDAVIAEINVLLAKAEEIANENDLTFDIDGIGPTFYPRSRLEEMNWLDSYILEDNPDGGWLGSSDFC